MTFSINQILIGFALIAIGILMVKYTFWMRNMTGPQEWLERYTGTGSTYGMYKILGVVLVLLGIVITTGLGQPLGEILLSPFTDLFRGWGGVS